MTVTLESAGLNFSSGGLQTTRCLEMKQIQSGSFTISAWSTWNNLFTGAWYTDNASIWPVTLFELQWGYDYSYYYGTQYISNQGGFAQQNAYNLNDGVGAGSLGLNCMNGRGCYGEYAGLYFNGPGHTNYFQVYVGNTSGVSGFVPSTGGTANWKLYAVYGGTI